MTTRSTVWTLALVLVIAVTAVLAAQTFDGLVVKARAGTTAVRITGASGKPSITATTPINAPMGPIVVATAAATSVASTVTSGTVYITKESGADGATTYTLPTPTAALAGKYWYFVQYNNLDMVITTAGGSNGDCIVTLNANAADTATWGTSSQKIGATGLAFCDGTNWYVSSLCGTVAGAG